METWKDQIEASSDCFMLHYQPCACRYGYEPNRKGSCHCNQDGCPVCSLREALSAFVAE